MELLERFINSQDSTDAIAMAIRNYFEWQEQNRSKEFIPSEEDDVTLRSYLFHLHTLGAGREVLDNQVTYLKRFYHWAHSNGVITRNPFDEYNFSSTFISNSQLVPLGQTLFKDMSTYEVERLAALEQITEQLNSSVDIKGALDSTLTSLLRVMNLQTGWVSIYAESHLSGFPADKSPSHGFALAAARGLPPGLEREEQLFLRQPPACHCQSLLLQGRLTRANNIVECTRLRDSLRASGNNAGLLYHASVPLISQGKPLGIINVATTDWQSLNPADLQFLSSVAAQLVIALERANIYEVADARRKRLEREFKVAREVQAGLMPQEMPDIPGYSIAGIWRPANEIGGDFYDIFTLNDGRWGLVIGDVADKGAAAALYMAIIHSLIYSGMLRHHSPMEVLKEVDLAIRKQFTSSVFVSVFLLVIDPKSHSITYVNAGHNPPIIRRSSGEIETLTTTGPVLGVFEDFQLSEVTISLKSGSAVVLYTDGVTEAWHPLNGDYGIDRLIAAIALAPMKANELLSYVESDFNLFTQDTPQQDDVTFLILSKD